MDSCLRVNLIVPDSNVILHKRDWFSDFWNHKSGLEYDMNVSRIDSDTVTIIAFLQMF